MLTAGTVNAPRVMYNIATDGGLGLNRTIEDNAYHGLPKDTEALLDKKGEGDIIKEDRNAIQQQDKLKKTSVSSKDKKQSIRIKFGSSVKSSQKLANQMKKKGWTEQTIQMTVDKPYTTRRSKNLSTGNSATTYYNEDGSYVIVDDITKEIVQISDCNDSSWIPDVNIEDPYRP